MSQDKQCRLCGLIVERDYPHGGDDSCHRLERAHEWAPYTTVTAPPGSLSTTSIDLQRRLHEKDPTGKPFLDEVELRSLEDYLRYVGPRQAPVRLSNAQLLDEYDDFSADYHRYSVPGSEYSCTIVTVAAERMQALREEILARLDFYGQRLPPRTL